MTTDNTNETPETVYPNLGGVTRSISDVGFQRLAEGADTEEVQAWAQMAMFLSALGGAIEARDWDLVVDLADGEIPSEEAAEALGWI